MLIISYSFTVLICKILFLPQRLENKSHIFTNPCKILYILTCQEQEIVFHQDIQTSRRQLKIRHSVECF